VVAEGTETTDETTVTGDAEPIDESVLSTCAFPETGGE
jgi:hypothetical protein